MGMLPRKTRGTIGIHIEALFVGSRDDRPKSVDALKGDSEIGRFEGGGLRDRARNMTAGHNAPLTYFDVEKKSGLLLYTNNSPD